MGRSPAIGRAPGFSRRAGGAPARTTLPEACPVRLRERILSIVLVVVLGVGAAAAAALVHLQRAAGLRQVELAAQTLASTIYHGLALSMIRNNPDEIGEILQHLQGEPMVRR